MTIGEFAWLGIKIEFCDFNTKVYNQSRSHSTQYNICLIIKDIQILDLSLFKNWLVGPNISKTIPSFYGHTYIGRRIMVAFIWFYFLCMHFFLDILVFSSNHGITLCSRRVVVQRPVLY